ncbi:MAG: DNA polymerase III subunit delta [Flavobacteriales bacterium]|nr:DNA polymerase III subunit delta [Flavobacteriales bacterium]MEB2342549.1 DNA polymerase III subunit delta [Flavobacteriia bacterium]
MSTTDDFRKLRKEFSSGTFKQVYFLHGEEPFFIDRVAAEIEQHALQEHERDFNLTILYGKDTEPSALVDTCLRYPMMAERQVVVLREAQAWVQRGNADPFDKLDPYFKNPTPSTVLVICYKHKKADGRKAWLKDLAKRQVVFTSDKLKEEKLPGWVQQYVTHHKRRIGPVESKLLADHLGSDLGKLINEVEKLCLVCEPGGSITSDLIQRYVGISKEFNIFELQNAMGNRDHYKAQRIAQFLGSDRNSPLVLTIGLLSSYFAKLGVVHANPGKSQADLAAALKVPPYFVRDYAGAARNYPPAKLKAVQHLLREADLRSKGVGNSSADDGDLLRELVARVVM